MRVYIYCVPSEGADQVPYQHIAVCLAEGFRALNIPCFSNENYWPLNLERTEFLFQHDPAIRPDDCDLVIVSDDWFTWGKRRMPERLFHRSRRYATVALDRQDGTQLITLGREFRPFDVILRTHYNEATRYPKNFRPWAYGLSERIIEATRTATRFDQRTRVLLANWRHTSNPHSVRLAVERVVLPRINSILRVDASQEQNDAPPTESYARVLWHETGKRHWPQYYQRLGSAAACACFGGFFVTRFPANKANVISRALRRVLRQSGRRSSLISQFDSWRLWESFAAGCATFHVDFDRYGCLFPEQPVNGVHYLGIDFDHLERTLDLLAESTSSLEQIAETGRSWALEHYGPRAAAERLLALLNI